MEEGQHEEIGYLKQRILLLQEILHVVKHSTFPVCLVLTFT